MKDALVLQTAAATDERLLTFLQAEVCPGAAARDTSGTPLPRHLLTRAADLGLYRHAGTGPRPGDFDPVRWGLTLEQIGYRCTDLSFPLLAYLTAGTIRRIRADGRQDLLEELGHPLVGFAYTEGRDPFDLQGSCTLDGDRLRVETHKTIVAGALTLDAFITYVPDQRQRPQAVLLHRQDAGVDIAPLATSGFRAAGFGTLTAHATTLPARRLLDSDGLAHAQRLLNAEAPFFVAAPLGRMRAIAESCAQHATTTVRHGSPLAHLPNVQRLLGRMHALVESARASVYRALDNYTGVDDLWAPHAWNAKYTVAEHATHVALLAQRLLGTAGFLREAPYSRHLRDFSGLISGGNPQDKIEIDLGAHTIATSPAARPLSDPSDER